MHLNFDLLWRFKPTIWRHRCAQWFVIRLLGWLQWNTRDRSFILAIRWRFLLKPWHITLVINDLIFRNHLTTFGLASSTSSSSSSYYKIVIVIFLNRAFNSHDILMNHVDCILCILLFVIRNLICVVLACNVLRRSLGLWGSVRQRWSLTCKNADGRPLLRLIVALPCSLVVWSHYLGGWFGRRHCCQEGALSWRSAWVVVLVLLVPWVLSL